MNTEIYKVLSILRQDHEEVGYSPCSCGNYSVAEKEEVEHMIKCYGVKQGIRKV